MPSPSSIASALSIQPSAAEAAVGMSPLTMGYNQFVAGRAIGPGLPRPFSDFLSGAFGPLSPLVPMPIDEPGESGRPFVRRWQYPVGWNLPVGQPGTEGLKLASFSQLRSYADIYSVVRAMLNIRKDELAGMDWDIGPTSDAQSQTKGQKAMVHDQHERARKCVGFFKHVDPDYYGFQSWFGALLEEMFVIDAIALHMHPTRIKGAGPFDSDLAALSLINGQTIRPLVDIYGATPRPPAPAYQQYLWGVPRADLMTIISNDDLEVMTEDMRNAGLGDADPDEEYRADQLMYLPRTRRVWTPYGFSAIEQALMPITLGLKRQEFLLDFFTEGTIPGVYVIAGDQYVTPAQQRQLQDSLNALAGDQAWKHRVIVLPPGSKTDPQKDLSWQEKVDQTIVEQVSMILHIQPHEVGMVPGGRTSGLGGKGMVEGQQDAVAEQRTAPDRKWFKETVFDYVIQDVFGQRDLEWKWVDFEEEEEAGQKATAEAAMISAGKLSIDETRIEDGLDPWNTPFTSKPYVVVGNQLVSLDPTIAPYPQQAAPTPPPFGPGGPPGAKDGPPGADGKPAGKPPFGGPPGAAGAMPPVEKPVIGPDGKPIAKPQALPAGQRSPIDLMNEAKPQGATGAKPGVTGATPKPVFGPQPGAGARGAKTGKKSPFAKKKMTVADLVKGRISYKDSKLPQIVHDYLLRSYPPKDVEWAVDPDIEWEYEPHVDMADINMARRPGGRNPEKVEAIAGSLDNGASMDPMVFVDVGNPNGLVIADGWHRTLGAEKAGWKDVPAFVGRNVPEKYVPLITGAMQDDSDSKKQAAISEMATLRRFLRKGGDVTRFRFEAVPEDIYADLQSGVLSLDGTRARIESYFDGITKYSEDQLRDDHGRWSSEGGDSVVSALAAGKSPEVQPGQVKGILAAAAKGSNDAVNLTELRVKGTFMFGGHGLGIPRSAMPQIPAAQRQAFLDHLAQRGVTATHEQVDPQALHPMQKEINAKDVGNSIDYWRQGSYRESVVSKDNYIIDGHHGWACAVAYSFEKPGFEMPVIRVNEDHIALLNDAEKWDSTHGVAHVGLSQMGAGKSEGIVKYSEDEPRVDSGPGGGEWTAGGDPSIGDQQVGHPVGEPQVRQIPGTSRWAQTCPHCKKEVWYRMTDQTYHHQMTSPSSGKTISVGAGLVPFDLAGSQPSPANKCPVCKAYLVDGECSEHGKPNAMKVSLLAAIDAELARRGVDLAKFSEDEERDASGKWSGGGGDRTGLWGLLSSDTFRPLTPEQSSGLADEGGSDEVHGFHSLTPEQVSGLSDETKADIAKFSEEEDRDDHGRWSAGGGGGDVTSHVTPEGFSIHPYRGSTPQTGFQVAMSGRTEKYPASIMKDKQALAKAILDCRSKNKDVFKAGGRMYIGGWVQDGKLWLEPSEHVASRADAVRMGTERNQISVWDNANQREIPTGGSGASA